MTNPTNDQIGLTDTFASRRYFRKFEAITGHLTRVAAVMQAEGEVSKEQVKVLTGYLMALTFTFRALSMKYLMVGRDTGRFFGWLEMDKRDSGFPVAAELMTMANDAQQAATHLANMPDETALKDDMVRTILSATGKSLQNCNSPCPSAYTTANWSRVGCSGCKMTRNANGWAISVTSGVNSCCIGRSMTRR